jgi:hypothetical protein
LSSIAKAGFGDPIPLANIVNNVHALNHPPENGIAAIQFW